MAGEPSTRLLRIAQGVREELASLLGDEVRDPGAEGAVVTGVVMAGDLRSARVNVRLLEGGDDAARRKRLIAALTRAAGMLRREVGQRLGLRFAPELRFFYDDGSDNASRVQELLAEIEADRLKK
ncbi:MAG TPA: 30S ribosome-binding factor RbfA [Polyangiaceae bacterium]